MHLHSVHCSVSSEQMADISIKTVNKIFSEFFFTITRKKEDEREVSLKVTDIYLKAGGGLKV